MSTLQVSNVHLESTGNNRIHLSTTGTVAVVAGGVSTVVANSTVVNIVAGGANAIVANSTTTSIAGGLLVNSSIGTAGLALLSGGPGSNAYWGTAGGNYNMQVFTNTTPGGTTWTKPAGLKAVKVTVVGGGAGTQVMPGGGGSAGGGGGGAAIGYLPAPSIPGPVTVTVGIGGPATAPTAGGTSSFGAFMSATGGATGFPISGPGNSGGAGGLGTGGTFNFSGGDGGATYTLPTPAPATHFFVGAGGASILGVAPATKISTSGLSAFAGNDYGAGASGNYRVPPAIPSGAAGGQGIVIVEEFY